MSSSQTSQPKSEEPCSGSETQTQTQTQTQSHTEAESQPPLDLHSLPPIYVLPTHLSLDALHQVEDHLVRGAAHLTYDLSEAGVVLGRLSHKKRAALELRARGVWTEEVPSNLSVPDRGEPPAKRVRVSGSNESDGKVSDGRSKEVAELDTETESEEDGVDGHPTEKHLKRPESGSTIPKETTRSERDIIQVIKLDWLYRCLSSKCLLPTDPFLIYRARKISPPASKSAGIIQRARQDAATRPQKQYPPTQYRPPKLHRTTTSEAEEEEANLPPPPDWVVNRLPYACQRRAPLHPPNEAFIQQLLKIRQIRYLTLDEIGVRAYSTSIAAIAAYPYKLRRASEILTLPGCDAKIAHLFSEFQSSTPPGALAAASQLDTDATLRTLNTFAQIWGVGAKTARNYYFARHWRDLDDIILHGWGSLSRVQQIGVKYYDELRYGVSRPQVEAIASTVQTHANLVRPHAQYDGVGIECILVGGYRRGKDVCGDVDLILTHRDESVTRDLIVDVLTSLESSHYITHTLHLNLSTSDRQQQALPYRGDVEGGRHFDSLDKAMVVWQDPVPASPSNTSVATSTQPKDEVKDKVKNTNTHHRVDIIVSPWRSIGCAVLGWTGDTTFERDLRRLAKKRHNWKFDSSGVRERDGKGRVLDLEAGGRTWEEREKLVFEAVVGEGMWVGAEGRCSF